MNKKELDILTIILFAFLFITVTNLLPYTPIGDTMRDFRTQNDSINIQQTYLTISFNDEFTVKSFSNLYFPIKAYQSFTINRDLRTISELQNYLKQGYKIANYSVTLVTYTITSDVKGTSVLIQDFLVTAYLGTQKIRETKFSGTTSKYISLQYAENDLVIDGYNFNLTFYLEALLQSLNGNAYLTVSDIYVQLKVTLQQEQEQQEPLPQPEDDSNVETSPRKLPLSSPSYTGNPSREILPYSWIIVIMDYRVIYFLLIILAVMICLLKKSKKIRH